MNYSKMGDYAYYLNYRVKTPDLEIYESVQLLSEDF